MQELFENPRKIKASIERLQAFDLSKNRFKDLIDLYLNEIGIIPYYPIQQRKGTVIFRARRNQDGINNLFRSVSEIGIKPEEYVTEFGRANIPNQTVFYASTNEETVIQEINQWYINEEGRFQDFISKGGLVPEWSPFTCFVTLSAWHIKEDITLGLLFGNESNRPLGIQEAKVKKDSLEHKSSNYKESWDLVINLFSSEFSKTVIKHQYDYKLSSLYNYLVLNNNDIEHNKIHPKLCGVKYASIANYYRGENMALSKECYEKSIEFIGANYCFATNNLNKKLGKEFTCTVGKDYSAVLNLENSFEYIDASDDWDYLMRIGDSISQVILPGKDGIRFVKTVKRLSPPT